MNLRSRVVLIALSAQTCLSTANAQVPGTILWEFPLPGDGYSPALAADQTVYVGTRDGYLVAVTNSALKWQLSGYGIGSPYYGAAIGSDGTVYIGFGTTNFYAVNPNGTAKWIFNLSAADFLLSCPAIGIDGTVYVAYEGPVGKLCAVSSNGQKLWEFPTPPGVAAGSPSIGADGTIYFFGGNKIYAVRPDGTRKWAFPVASGQVFHPPAIGKDGTVYVASNGKLYALFPESANPNGTKKWEFDGVGISQGTFCPTIGSDGTIYVGAGNYALYAIRENGTKKWEFQTGREFNYNAAAIGADGTIYLGAGDGFVYAIGNDGSFKWATDVAGAVGSAVVGSAVIGSNGVVYVNANRRLFAIKADVSSDTNPWPVGGRDLRRSGRVVCPHGIPCFDTYRVISNRFEGAVFGQPGRSHQIESSRDLLVWAMLTNCNSANGLFRIIDERSQPRQYYRIFGP